MFKFSLEKLLSYRQRAEEEKQRELFVAKTELQALENRLAQLTEIVHDHERSFNEKSIQGMTSAEMGLYHHFLVKLSENICHLGSEKGVIEQKLEERRLALIEAEKDVKILMKLCEKERTVYLKEESRLEQIFLDEMGISGFIRHKDKVEG